MKTKVLSTISEKAKGVIGRDNLEPDEIYIFTGIDAGTHFHMKGVKFPIDIAFLDKDCGILAITAMNPDSGTAKAPEHACFAVEARNEFYKSNKLKVGDFFKEVYCKISQNLL